MVIFIPTNIRGSGQFRFLAVRSFLLPGISGKRLVDVYHGRQYVSERTGDTEILPRVLPQNIKQIVNIFIVKYSIIPSDIIFACIGFCDGRKPDAKITGEFTIYK